MGCTWEFRARWLLMLAVSAFPQAILAQTTWQLSVGSQHDDCTFVEGKLSTVGCQAVQGMAFEPNEIWIHAGDGIKWTHRTDEAHTVTFLQSGQARPSSAVGCTSVTGAVTSPDSSDYDPAGGVSEQCVNSGSIAGKGDTYTVRFPSPGNYKFTCLIHASMYGTVHVLDSSAALPHGQSFYDAQRATEANTIYNSPVPFQAQSLVGPNQVAMGGMVVGSGGGWGYESVFRFLRPVTIIRAGQTVEWINFDPAEPHTITFGCPTDDATCPTGGGPTAHVNTSGPIALAADGAWAAEMASAFNPNTDAINSGFLVAARQDAAGQPQAVPSTTRFRIKFDHPGTFRYICELHDELGMIGWVVVLP